MDGGLETLIPIEEAYDAHEAVGVWWARLLLSHHFDLGSSERRIDDKTRQIRLSIEEQRHQFSVERRSLMEAHIGKFAMALAGLSRADRRARIQSDYYPEPILTEAALLSGMCEEMQEADVMRLFPVKCETWIWLGKVRAKAGETSKFHRVWPPQDQ